MKTISALNPHKAIVLPVGVAVRGMLSPYCRACFGRMAGASLKFLATGISILHLAWILLLIFGAFWTRRRPFWTAVHLLSLVWGIIVEVGPWPCPLTLAEQSAGRRQPAGRLHSPLCGFAGLSESAVLGSCGVRGRRLRGQPGGVCVARLGLAERRR